MEISYAELKLHLEDFWDHGMACSIDEIIDHAIRSGFPIEVIEWLQNKADDDVEYSSFDQLYYGNDTHSNSFLFDDE